MSLALLKPHVLAYKNRLLNRRGNSRVNRESLALLLSLGLAFAVYWVNVAFIESLRSHPAYQPVLLENLLRLFLFGFFTLLLFSNTIVALSSLFMANDIPLLLVAPISNLSLFSAKLVEVILTSSWIFMLFAIPVVLACSEALGLPAGFIATCVFAMIPFLVIPASLSIILVTLFVNLIPPHRMRDLLVIVAFLASCALLFYGHQSPDYFPTEERKMNELISFLGEFRDPQPLWLPSRWVSELLSPYFGGSSQDRPLLVLLLASAGAGCAAISYLVFDSFFQRGLTVAGQGSKHARVYSCLLYTSPSPRD